MKTASINLYEFKELKPEIQEKVIKKWYEQEDYPEMEDVFTDRLKDLLTERGIEFENLSLIYSLSYSQGDGLCFTGELFRDNHTLELTHTANYYYANSVTTNLDSIDDETEEYKNVLSIKNSYLEVCKILEEEGYSYLEYRMNDEEFQEHCEVNDFWFEEDGTQRNN